MWRTWFTKILSSRSRQWTHPHVLMSDAFLSSHLTGVDSPCPSRSRCSGWRIRTALPKSKLIQEEPTNLKKGIEIQHLYKVSAHKPPSEN